MNVQNFRNIFFLTPENWKDSDKKGLVSRLYTSEI